MVRCNRALTFPEFDPSKIVGARCCLVFGTKSAGKTTLLHDLMHHGSYLLYISKVMGSTEYKCLSDSPMNYGIGPREHWNTLEITDRAKAICIYDESLNTGFIDVDQGVRKVIGLSRYLFVHKFRHLDAEYVFMFRGQSRWWCKKLYAQYGHRFAPTLSEFELILAACTAEEHECLIFDRRANEVFRYVAPKMEHHRAACVIQRAFKAFLKKKLTCHILLATARLLRDLQEVVLKKIGLLSPFSSIRR